MRGEFRPGGWPVRAAVALGAPAAVVMILTTAGWGPLLALDSAVARDLHGPALAHPGWTHTMRILTDWVWDPWTFRLLLALAVAWLLWRGQRVRALWVTVTTLVGSGLQQGLKAALDRERPRWQHPVDSADYAAMPSGHAMTAALACVLLLWLLRGALDGASGGAGHGVLWRAAWALACVSVVGVAFTRVWLGVHWLTDTVAGTLLGLALGLAAVACRPRAGGRTAGAEPTAVRAPGGNGA